MSEPARLTAATAALLVSAACGGARSASSGLADTRGTPTVTLVGNGGGACALSSSGLVFCERPACASAPEPCLDVPIVGGESLPPGAAFFGIPDGGANVGVYRVARADTNLIASSRVTLLAASGARACGLTRAGRAFCWGDRSGVPELLVEREPIVDLATADDFACGLFVSGEVGCWGEGVARAGMIPPAPKASVRVPSLRATRIFAGGDRACAVDPQGGVVCWGKGPGASWTAPAPLPNVHGLRALTLGRRHACAVDAAGALLCWGNNDLGQLGLGDRAPREVPTRVPLNEPLQAVAVDAYRTCISTASTTACAGLVPGGAEARRATAIFEPLAPPGEMLLLSPARLCRLGKGRVACGPMP